MSITISKESLQKFQDMKDLESNEIGVLSGKFGEFKTTFICRVSHKEDGSMEVTPLYIEFVDGMQHIASGPNGEPLTENKNGN